MKRVTDEARMLARLAEQDWEILQVIKVSPRIGMYGLCFHAQQCIEKYLKAIIVSHGVIVDRTHNLAALAKLLGDRAGPQPYSREELAQINPCAVTIRYDDQLIEALDREWLLDVTSQFRTWARSVLGLENRAV